jgi:hypothetical protein
MRAASCAFGAVTLSRAFRAASFFLACCTATFAIAAVGYRPIALSGTTGASFGYGPNMGNGVFFQGVFGEPVINASGQVAYSAWIAGTGIDLLSDGQGIWLSSAGASSLVARSGTSALGPSVGDGIVFDGLGTNSSGSVSINGVGKVYLNDAGKVAFSALLTGTSVTSSNDTGIWTTASGSLAVVARTGTQGPGPNVESGRYFTLIGRPNLNSAGKVAFYGATNSMTSTYGLWSNRGGSVAPIMRTGSTAPGPSVEAGTNFSQTPSLFVSGFNDAGQVLFYAPLTTGSPDSGVWLNTTGTNSLIERYNTPVPGPTPGAGALWAKPFDRPALNRSGAVTFTAQVSGTGITTANDTGIWSNVGGSWNAIAREGTSGPGPNLGANVYFADFGFKQLVVADETFADRIVLNSAGRVAFDAQLTGAGVTSANNTGIWTNPNGQLTAIARTGSATLGPNLGSDTTFATFGNYGMNEQGDIVFAATLAGSTVDTTNDAGLWMWHNGALTKIIRKGDVIDLDPTPKAQNLQTVTSVSFVGSGGEDGKQSAINDRGQVVYSVRTDPVSGSGGFTGILTSQLLLLGDFNLDGAVDKLDLPEMLKALTNLNAYQTKYNLSNSDLLAIGDINGDYNASTGKGGFNNRDIQSLLNILQSQGSGSLDAVPEPASSWLMSLCGAALFMLVARSRSRYSLDLGLQRWLERLALSVGNLTTRLRPLSSRLFCYQLSLVRELCAL